MKKFIVPVTLASVFVLVSFGVSARGIYGDDNRRDVYEAQDPAYAKLAKSTAAMMAPTALRLNEAGDYNVVGTTLQNVGICSNERFSTQPMAAGCSGFLVANNILVTAGHCVPEEKECKARKWVFDYKMDSADQKEIVIPKASVYSCKKILSQKLTILSGNDYAIIELDRPVLDRQPLRLRRRGKIDVNEDVFVIGHPIGLPTKIADGAKVRSKEYRVFTTNLDAYGGNSGSAVFNARTLEVEGILVRGGEDFVSAGLCKRSVVCEEDGCRGEKVTYISNLKELGPLL